MVTEHLHNFVAHIDVVVCAAGHGHHDVWLPVVKTNFVRNVIARRLFATKHLLAFVTHTVSLLAELYALDKKFSRLVLAASLGAINNNNNKDSNRYSLLSLLQCPPPSRCAVALNVLERRLSLHARALSNAAGGCKVCLRSLRLCPTVFAVQ